MPRGIAGLTPSKILRVALAMALAWGAGELVVWLGRPGPRSRARSEADAATGLRAALAGLRAPLAAEPDRARRRRVAADVLTMLDAGRREADLRSAALRGDEARRKSWPRVLGPALRGSAIDPVALGEALRPMLLSAARRTDRGRDVPDELAAHREELADWLAGKEAP